MEAMVLCAAVWLLGEERRVERGKDNTGNGVSFLGSRLRAEAFCVHLPYTAGCCSLRHLQSAVSKPDLRSRFLLGIGRLRAAGWQGQTDQRDQKDLYW